MLSRRFIREYSAQYMKEKKQNQQTRLRKRQNSQKKEIRQLESTQTWCEYVIHNHKLFSHETDEFRLNGDLSINVRNTNNIYKIQLAENN